MITVTYVADDYKFYVNDGGDDGDYDDDDYDDYDDTKDGKLGHQKKSQMLAIKEM